MNIFQNISSFIEGITNSLFNVEEHVKGITEGLEKKVRMRWRRIKREIMRTFLHMLMIALSIILFAAGIVVFLNRYLPLDAVLIGLGVIALYVALLIHSTMK